MRDIQEVCKLVKIDIRNLTDNMSPISVICLYNTADLITGQYGRLLCCSVYSALLFQLIHHTFVYYRKLYLMSEINE